jgi:hypothetical protein
VLLKGSMQGRIGVRLVTTCTLLGAMLHQDVERVGLDTRGELQPSGLQYSVGECMDSWHNASCIHLVGES